MSAELFAEMPFGCWGGERLPVVKPEAAPPPAQPLVIEPPPWAGQESDPTLAAPVVERRLDALTELRSRDVDDDRWPDPTAPVEWYEPLARPLPPPPDWRAEEAERQRQKAAEAQHALEPTRSSYPAPRGAERAPREP
jgi:hypothetical protein